MKKERFETSVIHAGYDSSHFQGSLVPPLYQTSTFTFDNAEQGEKRFAGEEPGFIYSRLGNPTVKLLETRIAELENGEAGLAFGSGMAAVSGVLFALLKAGDHILCSQGVYGCTFGLLSLLNEKFLITHDFSRMGTKEELVAGIKAETACIYVETPINPTMKLVDLQMVAEVGRQKGIPIIVDNTFCSPYLQTPISLGCDVVIHSATKYICGHGDVIAGLAVGTRAFMDMVSKTTLKDIGGIIAPFDAWLLLRGLKTLPVRMDRHCENAEKLASFLKKHPQVDRIFFPGDQEHSDYKIAATQMRKPGGLISFTIKGTKHDAQQFMNQLNLIKIAVSLGDAETLIQHPATMTHAVVPQETRKQMEIEDNLLRLSVGLEAWQDIEDDLAQAFAKMN
ncbi:methionine gamma-lyase [Bacillus canaveralius]|uniref:L-methionine gamma-lyase n=1 Tax=Bacillus canaveralius TaxID=1403243 RepID=A0A2N5GN52_9BACI|nr:methionine gamma-lyase [Bacillus canaveralius]PLR83707.1 methionine gamma-lyase [Bacillus canaveralius]PLR95191.1 methionine gamma-lyase [Bacillus canaveralius]